MSPLIIGICLIVLGIIVRIISKPLYLAEKAKLIAQKKPRAPAKYSAMVKTAGKYAMYLGIIVIIASVVIKK